MQKPSKTKRPKLGFSTPWWSLDVGCCFFFVGECHKSPLLENWYGKSDWFVFAQTSKVTKHSDWERILLRKKSMKCHWKTKKSQGTRHRPYFPSVYSNGQHQAQCGACPLYPARMPHIWIPPMSSLQTTRPVVDLRPLRWIQYGSLMNRVENIRKLYAATICNKLIYACSLRVALTKL